MSTVVTVTLQIPSNTMEYPTHQGNQ